MRTITIALIFAILLAGLSIPAQASHPPEPPTAPQAGTAITDDEGGSGITPPIFCFWRQGIRVCIKRKAPTPPPLRPKPIQTR
jgi:hypothetical protein